MCMHERKTSFPGIYQQKQVRAGAKESRRGGQNMAVVLSCTVCSLLRARTDECLQNLPSKNLIPGGGGCS